MLLNIYLGSVAINAAVLSLYTVAVKNYLERKGYKMRKEDLSISERLVRALSNAFFVMLPVYNVLTTAILLTKGTELFEILEVKLLLEDKIYKPGEEDIVDEDRNYNHNKHRLLSRSNEGPAKTTQKSYEEMTTEEKLEFLRHERERLTGQDQSRIREGSAYVKK